jgi:hypothetical protein
MNHVHHACRSLASLTRRASILLACTVAGRPAVAVATRPGPSRRTTHSLPHTIMTPIQSPAQTAPSGSNRVPWPLPARLCAGLGVALGAAGMVLCGCASPAHPSPAPHPASSGSLPLGVFPGPSPGSYVVDCFAAQCTTQPGAGPFGTTCRTPNTSTDEQYCPASRRTPARPAAPSPASTPSS